MTGHRTSDPRSTALHRRATIAVAVAFAVFVAGSSSAGNLGRRARFAARYIVSQQQADGSIPAFSPLGSTADAVLSLVAAQRGPAAIDKALQYLADHVDEATTIGLKAKLTMAAVAARKDPNNFAGHNLPGEIRGSQQEDGRYGANTPVFEHALAILALKAAGDEPESRAIAWLAAAQCADGGWQYDQPSQPGEDEHCRNTGASDAFGSDTNTTSLAVQALALATPLSEEIKQAIRYFRSIRDSVKHGWGYDNRNRLTDANSTSMVLQAFKAAGKVVPEGSVNALKNLQYRLCGRKAGAFAYTWQDKRGGGYRKTSPDVGATISGVLGLLREPLPVRAATPVTEPPPTARPC